jgi:sulfoxide reductase heme-binding subunit YedZ
MRVRRALGLYTFGYVAVHLLTYAWWDYGLQLDLLMPALFGQEFVLYGIAALLLMVPLAVTSTKGWRRRLGRRWQWLHWLFYPASLLAAAHFLRIGKDPTIALRYMALILALLVVRLPWIRRAIERGRSRLLARWQERRAETQPTRQS